MGTTEKPAWAQALKARRAEVVGSQEELSARTNISQSLISQLERGSQHPGSVAVERFGRLLDALNWTVHEFSEATGVDIPGLVTPGQTGIPPLSPCLIRHAGTIGTGLNPSMTAMDYSERRLMPSHPALEGYAEADLVTLDVVGNSMACDDVRPTIPEGSTVYLHLRLEPQPGDIVAVWVEREQRGILKVYGPRAGHIILQSYNDHHTPIVLQSGDCDYLQGVYLAHIVGGRRAHRPKTMYR